MLPDATRRFLVAAGVAGLEPQVREFPQGTKTAEDAARAVGCPVAAIVKSLVFLVDGEPVVALIPGDMRLDTDKLAQAAGGSSAMRAGLDEVKRTTGYAAGGTPPFGHQRPLRVFADEALRRHDPLWVAAGTPTTVFSISIADLGRASGANWSELSE